MRKDNEKRRTNFRKGGHETRSLERSARTTRGDIPPDGANRGDKVNTEIRKDNEATYHLKEENA